MKRHIYRASHARPSATLSTKGACGRPILFWFFGDLLTLLDFFSSKRAVVSAVFFLVCGVRQTAAQPVITSQPRSLTVTLGQSAAFSVSATSPGSLSYQWTFRGDEIPGQTNNTLHITNAAMEHLGRYGVRLRSSTGTAESQSASLSLLVTVKPDFDPGFAVQATGNTLALSWVGEGIVQRAASPSGPWTDVEGKPTTPYTTALTSLEAFYRLRNPHPRTATVFVPSSYRQGSPMPLILALHPYVVGGAADVESYFHLQPVAEAQGFLYCHPQGVVNPAGVSFWNAWSVCCDRYGQEIDDSGFLRSLIQRIHAELGADPKRIHILGHSNGGFMAYRMAIDHSELIASIASVSGAMDKVSPLPPPAVPVNVLEIHGTADATVLYDGDDRTTGARESVQRWATWNGCEGMTDDPGPSLDLDSSLGGLDTVVTRTFSCSSGAATELWTVLGGKHTPNLSATFSAQVTAWLLAHRKP